MTIADPATASRGAAEPAAMPHPDGHVGTVGSPSTTGEVIVDIAEGASDTSLLGDMVYLTHPVADGRHLFAVGTVTDIETRNRWHEDANMRGVLKAHGSLPHLSGIGDTRTAKVLVQAVYQTDAGNPPFQQLPAESGGALGMSPTTGTPVRRVDNDVVSALVARHHDEIVYLGRVYRSDVLLPLYVKDYQGTDGAFHTGIFGRTGSGKTSFALYLLAAQMRHRGLGVLVFDPQGQFANQRDFPLDLQGWARSLGRNVVVRSLASDLRMSKNAPLLIQLLPLPFYRQLTISGQSRPNAAFELERLLTAQNDWNDRAASEVLRQLLSDLLADARACERILLTPGPRDRMRSAIQRLLDDDAAFQVVLQHFEPQHNLFAPRNLDGGQRHALHQLLHQTLTPTHGEPASYVILDVSSSAGAGWLDSDETKALLIRKIAGETRRIAEQRWRETREVANCCVVFDEAHRFAGPHAVGEQAEALCGRLGEYVRETRKYGLGWTFITQEIGSLSPAIYSQLRIRAYGYGLSSGSDLARLSDEIGRGAALELYKSFPDPNALSARRYPFMIHGPVSPLSFTSAPVFLEVFTDIEEFRARNATAFAG